MNFLHMQKENMDKLLDNIYKKFFLRDVISIFMCGFLFLLAMLMIYGEQIKQIKDITFNPIVRKILINKDNELSLFSYGLLIGVSYALGLIINWFRDFVQFKWFYNKTNKKSNYGENVKDYREKVDKFDKNNKDSTEITGNFERMIVIFQVTGNFTLTIILCIIIWLLSLIPLVRPYIPYSVIILFIAALICFSFFKFKEHITYLEEKSK